MSIKSLAELNARGWLTVPEFARVIGLSSNTIRTYIKRKRLNAVLVGNSYRIHTDEATRFINEGNAQSDRDGPLLEKLNEPEV